MKILILHNNSFHFKFPFKHCSVITEYDNEFYFDGYDIIFCDEFYAKNILNKNLRQPIILLSNNYDEYLAKELFKIGLQDYFTIKYLRDNIKDVGRLLFQAIERKKLHFKLNKLSNIDGLTKIHNHLYIKNYLRKIFQNSLKNNIIFSCVLIDVDDFKMINDYCGHLKGDLVLTHIAKLLQSNFRTKDVVGRYGGDEFIAILPNTDVSEAKTLVNKVLDKIRECDFHVKYKLDYRSDFLYNVTVSVGISEFNKNLTSYEKVISLADKLLYEAKKCGKNNIKII